MKVLACNSLQLLLGRGSACGLGSQYVRVVMEPAAVQLPTHRHTPFAAAGSPPAPSLTAVRGARPRAHLPAVVSGANPASTTPNCVTCLSVSRRIRPARRPARRRAHRSGVMLPMGAGPSCGRRGYMGGGEGQCFGAQMRRWKKPRQGARTVECCALKCGACAREKRAG